ncbi:hydrogenase nickel incorporation protein HypA [candidate division KSB1 bacterium]|nr:hydrogenase nickel incorporation protein HypA [candidate division KSB1 bacterium]
MHEWALAEAVISTALEVSKKEKLKKITKIKLMMGELQQIDREIFEFALKEIIQPQSPKLRGTEIEFETEKAVLKCRICGNQWAFDDTIKRLSEEESEFIHFIPEIAHVYVRCPECKSSDFEVVKGRGVWIDSISGER